MKKYRSIINISLFLLQIVLSFYLLSRIIVLSGAPGPRHIVNFTAMVLLSVSYFKNKNVFTLLLGLVLLAGNFAGLSAFEIITTYDFFIYLGSLPIPLYWGAPFYSLLLFIYLAANKGFYIGIVTKAYWTGFLTRTEDLEAVYTTVNAEADTSEKQEQTDTGDTSA